jgi:phage repressor protein C with HTH and peptisase S24 domain
MKVEDLLKLIDQHNADTGETDKALSLRSGLSGEGIRNWRRSIRAGKTPGANAGSIDKVLRAIGKPPTHDGVTHAVPARIEGDDETPDGSRLVDVLDISASAGDGMIPSAYEAVATRLAFPPDYLRSITNTSEDNLAIISVVGSSMQPTLNHDDIVMVDMTKTDIDYDGMFVIRVGEAIKVKRVSYGPKRRSIVVRSDNPNKLQFPDETYEDDEDLAVIGRVVWVGAKQP